MFILIPFFMANTVLNVLDLLAALPNLPAGKEQKDQCTRRDEMVPCWFLFQDAICNIFFVIVNLTVALSFLYHCAEFQPRSCCSTGCGGSMESSI